MISLYQVEEKVMFSSGEQSRALSQEETTILQKNALQRKLENISSVRNILLENFFQIPVFSRKYSLFF